MYFHPLDEYIYYLEGSALMQRPACDRSAPHCGRFSPQKRPMGCAICTILQPLLCLTQFDYKQSKGLQRQYKFSPYPILALRIQPHNK